MNILSHMESVPGHKGLELGDCDDCSSQEDYLKANYSVDDLMKRKSTDEDLTNLPTKRVKYEDYTSSSLNNHHDS